jgi:dTDP-4-amino-4,6-dideoxygalactose transaminase
MDELSSIAREYNLLLFEDCAQAHGATFQGKTVGTFGHAGAFSFYATKNMTTGEGGMVVTDCEDIYRQALLFVNHGSVRKYHHVLAGYNYRLNEIAAAIGLVQLAKLPYFCGKRRSNAQYLSDRLHKLSWLILPAIQDGIECVYHHYTIRTSRRDELASHMQNSGIECAVHYPLPLHRQHLYLQLGYGGISLPVSEKAAKHVLSIPVHPGLSRKNLEQISSAILEFT